MLQVGARNMQNFSLLRMLALIKRADFAQAWALSNDQRVAARG